MPTSVITVTNSQELAVAMSTLAKEGGGIIQVEASDDPYAISRYKGGTPDGEIVITAADPDNPPVFEQVKLIQSQNLTFSGLTFNSVESDLSGKDLEILDSSNITFENNVFVNSANGYYDGSDPSISQGESFALVRDSDDFTFVGNQVSNYYQGLAIIDSVGSEIIGNTFSELSGDGVRLSGVQDTLIEGNTFNAFYGTSQDINHSDMIQVWSAGYNTLNTEDLVIRGNFLNSAGGAATQSILILNETFPDSGVKYKNITVEDNVIYNGHIHGVTIEYADGVNISNNTLLWNAGAAMLSTPTAEPESNPPQIRLSGVENGIVSENITHGIVSGNNVDSRNVIVDFENPALDNYVGQNFVNAFDGGDVDLRDLALRPTSEWAGEYGAAATQPNVQTGPVTAVISQEHATGNFGTVLYSAAFSFGPEGLLPEDDTAYVWTFSDGTILQGLEVVHSFDDPGVQEVTLTVSTPSGSNSVTRSTLVEADTLVSLDFDGAIADSSTYGTTITEIGDTASVAGVDGNGYQLTGTNKLQLDRENEHLHSMATFTIGISLKRDPGGDAGTFLHMHNTLNASITDKGAVALTLRTSDGSFTLETIPGLVEQGTWHDIVFTFGEKDGGLRIYVDGTLAAQTDATGIIAPTGTLHDLVIGNSWNDSLQGTVDNFSLTKSVRTDFPVVDPPEGEETGGGGSGSGSGGGVDWPEPDGNTLLELSFEDGIIDESGTDTSLRTVSKTGEVLVDGLRGQGFELDGSNKLVINRTETQFHDLEAYSIAFSLQTPENGDDGVFLHMHGGLSLQVLESGALVLNMNTTDGKYAITTEPGVLNDMDWQRIVIVYDGTPGGQGLELHVDGFLVGQASATGALLSTGRHSLLFGNTWKDSAEALVDDILILDEAMTRSEVAVDYIIMAETEAAMLAAGGEAEDAQPLTLISDDLVSPDVNVDVDMESDTDLAVDAAMSARMVSEEEPANTDLMMALALKLLQNRLSDAQEDQPAQTAEPDPADDLFSTLPVDSMIFDI